MNDSRVPTLVQTCSSSTSKKPPVNVTAVVVYHHISPLNSEVYYMMKSKNRAKETSEHFYSINAILIPAESPERGGALYPGQVQRKLHVHLQASIPCPTRYLPSVPCLLDLCECSFRLVYVCGTPMRLYSRSHIDSPKIPDYPKACPKTRMKPIARGPKRRVIEIQVSVCTPQFWDS